MIKTKKQKREESSLDSAKAIADGNNKAMSEPKNICLYIIEGGDFNKWNDLDMWPCEDMVNRAELSILKSKRTKSLMRDANAVMVFGELNGDGNFKKLNRFWYKTI